MHVDSDITCCPGTSVARHISLSQRWASSDTLSHDLDEASSPPAGVTPQRDAGTHGIFGVLRHPSQVVRPDGPEEGASDPAAVRVDEARSVSCFLRGQRGPYQRQLRQGTMVPEGRRALWTPFWSLCRRPLAMELGVQTVQTRPADHREPNVKKGGPVYGVIEIPAFQVASCQTASGTVDFAVPPGDPPLRHHPGCRATGEANSLAR